MKEVKIKNKVKWRWKMRTMQHYVWNNKRKNNFYMAVYALTYASVSLCDLYMQESPDTSILYSSTRNNTQGLYSLMM